MMQAQWPPPEEQERLADYTQARLLRRGYHYEVFIASGDYTFQEHPNRPYVACNLLGRMSRLLAWRLFGEQVVKYTGPSGEDDTQGFIDWFVQVNHLARLNIRAVLAASSLGDAVYKLRYNLQRRRVVVELLDPSVMMVETDPLYTSDPIGYTIGTVLVDEDNNDYLWLERHVYNEEGYSAQIANELYRVTIDTASGIGMYDTEDDRVELGTIDQTASLKDVVETGLTEPTVVHVVNGYDDLDPVYGVSDYSPDLRSNNGEINNRLTQRGMIQDKHSDPPLYGPDIRDSDGNVNLPKNKYFIVPDGWTGPPPMGYVVWDAQMASVQEAIKDLTERFFAVAGIDMASMFPNSAGASVPSGKALRLSQLNTQSTVGSYHLVFRPALRQVISLATQIANLDGVVLPEHVTRPLPLQPEDVDVSFGDGLPVDREEQIAYTRQLMDARLTTRKRALMTLDDMSEQQAQELLDEIDSEQPEVSVPNPFEQAGLLG